MLKISDKFNAFLHCNAKREYLEGWGTTAAGKTTVGLYKFMLKVAESKLKYHVIAAQDVGIAEKNLVNSERGVIS